MAVAEAFAGGGDVKGKLAALRQPRGAAPLWLWLMIGSVYYAISFTVLVRLFSLPVSTRSLTAITLMLVMMAMNTIWTFTFFRLRSLGFSAFITWLYLPVAAALLYVLHSVDRMAFFVFAAYALYLVYGSWWALRVWQLNKDHE
jgi:tryptophan-rich sensory protein